ncbi:MAG: FMN-binding negative transcriptional regulator [Chlorobi bacterium]|nr:FMN-binding negative transcriptional regulator [Chlorobiota bacterium]MCI0716297.1 FMN-binding negative transcriptional regulator [Chlorobiota bacterium]
MYIPKHFEENDRKKLVEFMKEYNFATLVNTAKKRYWATHLPFLIFEEGDNIILRAHIAKANPQWTNFKKSEEVLVIFHQPHSYISPSLYENKVSVPTWNYIAVHAYGVPEILPSVEQRIDLLQETFKVFEAKYKLQWDTLPEDYKNDLLSGIVAFEIKVTNLEGKFKLSQNRTEEDRERIIAHLSANDEKVRYDIAKFMSEIKGAK